MPNLIVTRGLGSINKLPTRGYGPFQSVTPTVKRGGRSNSVLHDYHRNYDRLSYENKKNEETITIIAELIELNDEISSQNIKGRLDFSSNEILPSVRVITEYISTRVNRLLTDIVIYIKHVKRKSSNGRHR